jgi:hypothetical protein
MLQRVLRLRSSLIIQVIILIKRIICSDIHGFHGLNYWLGRGFQNLHNMRPFRGYRMNSRRPIGMLGWGDVKGDRRS